VAFVPIPVLQRIIALRSMLRCARETRPGESESEQDVLRKIIAALILVPLAVVLIAFAVANRQGVTVSFDPFSTSAPASTLTLPLFLLLIVALIIGVIVGGAAVRLGHGKWRRLARRFEREAGELRDKLEALHESHAEPSIVPREQSPPPRLRLKPPVRQ
jgi:uncharacterized integral membrane protein